MSNNDSHNGRLVVPFSEEVLSQVIDIFDKASFYIDYEESIKNFNYDNKKFLDYLTNCNMYQIFCIFQFYRRRFFHKYMFSIF